MSDFTLPSLSWLASAGVPAMIRAAAIPGMAIHRDRPLPSQTMAVAR